MSSGEEFINDQMSSLILDVKTLSSIVPELLELRRSSLANRSQDAEVVNKHMASGDEPKASAINNAKNFLKEVLKNMDQSVAYEERKFKSLTGRIETLQKIKSTAQSLRENEKEELSQNTMQDMEIKLAAHKQLYRRMKKNCRHVIECMYGDGVMLDLLQTLKRSYTRNVAAYIEFEPELTSQVTFLYDNDLIEMNPKNPKEIRFADIFD